MTPGGIPAESERNPAGLRLDSKPRARARSRVPARPEPLRRGPLSQANALKGARPVANVKDGWGARRLNGGSPGRQTPATMRGHR
jgi:hypothetical protein